MELRLLSDLRVGAQQTTMNIGQTTLFILSRETSNPHSLFKTGIFGDEVILLVALRWVSYDGQAPRPLQVSGYMLDIL